MMLLGVLSSVQAQGLDPSPCDTQDDCATVMCCGWAVPLKPGEGVERKICYRPQSTTYTDRKLQDFSFQCDPVVDKINMDAETYAARFWKNMKKDGPMNIPGYGASRPYVPPI